MPLLIRGLRDRSDKTKRRACVIVDNMCKLVPEVMEIQPFLPELMPLITRVKETCSDPEVRNVAENCYLTLKQAQEADPRKDPNKDAIIETLRKGMPGARTVVCDLTLAYVADLCVSLSGSKCFEKIDW